ncbi:MAG: four helix bundle protein [Spirulinaceae cyanobacterium]
MAKQTFENLPVYQLAEQLANEVWTLVKNWDFFAQDTVGKSLVNAADRIGARIAEGNGRSNLVENRRFVQLAKGSLYETIHWLRIAYSRNLLTAAEINQLREIVIKLSPQIRAYLKTLEE